MDFWFLITRFSTPQKCHDIPPLDHFRRYSMMFTSLSTCILLSSTEVLSSVQLDSC